MTRFRATPVLLLLVAILSTGHLWAASAEVADAAMRGDAAAVRKLLASKKDVNAAQTASGIRPGMVQNDSFGSWGMSTFDPRQIELRVRLFF